LGGITVGPEELQVAVSRELVRAAPNIELHSEELSQEGESALYHHFELNYTPPITGGDACSSAVALEQHRPRVLRYGHRRM
jgi:hypothetical protein